MTQSDLQKLSEEASGGPWFIGQVDDQWYAYIHDVPDGWDIDRHGYRAFADRYRDGEFIVALVNAFREGRLVEATRPDLSRSTSASRPMSDPYRQEETQ